jgi:hypothetical protein
MAMPDDDSIWQSILDDRGTTRQSASDEGGRAFPPGSRARLLDAAIVVVRAARDLAAVAEEVLVERRDRLGQRDPPAAPQQDDGRADERIDLTY